MAVIGLDVGQCITTGDRLYTEIKMGIDSGMDTAVVFTGETTPEILATWPEDGTPTYALDRIDRLIPELLWRELGWTDDDRQVSTSLGREVAS